MGFTLEPVVLRKVLFEVPHAVLCLFIQPKSYDNYTRYILISAYVKYFGP